MDTRTYHTPHAADRSVSLPDLEKKKKYHLSCSKASSRSSRSSSSRLLNLDTSNHHATSQSSTSGINSPANFDESGARSYPTSDVRSTSVPDLDSKSKHSFPPSSGISGSPDLNEKHCPDPLHMPSQRISSLPEARVKPVNSSTGTSPRNSRSRRVDASRVDGARNRSPRACSSSRSRFQPEVDNATGNKVSSTHTRSPTETHSSRRWTGAATMSVRLMEESKTKQSKQQQDRSLDGDSKCSKSRNASTRRSKATGLHLPSLNCTEFDGVSIPAMSDRNLSLPELDGKSNHHDFPTEAAISSSLSDLDTKTKLTTSRASFSTSRDPFCDRSSIQSVKTVATTKLPLPASKQTATLRIMNDRKPKASNEKQYGRSVSDESTAGKNSTTPSKTSRTKTSNEKRETRSRSRGETLKKGESRRKADDVARSGQETINVFSAPKTADASSSQKSAVKNTKQTESFSSDGIRRYQSSILIDSNAASQAKEQAHVSTRRQSFRRLSTKRSTAYRPKKISAL